jgi:hypothetical protein
MFEPTDKQKAFLAAFALTGNVSAAARAAAVNRRTHYEWLEDPGYAAAFEDAQEEATDRLEEEARRRAVQGVVKFKFHSQTGTPLKHPITGEPYYELEYSDSLIALLLKANRPEKYAERVKQDVTVTPKMVIGVDLDQI